MKIITQCPFCNQSNTVELVKEDREHIVKDKIYSGEFILYRCSNCKEGFTTTETDTFSINNLKQKVK